ncbi:MAG: GGDEF domain-containing protein [Gammaproteobacteria bacterium]|nr:GGDEF domain-containing protein [Gammaproteobacteria bacterium]
MNSLPFTKDRAGKITPKILSEQTRFSYDVFPITIAMLIVAISLISYLVWQSINKDHALYWFSVAISVVLIRIMIYLIYKNSDQERESIAWRYAFLFGAYLSAGLICAAAVLFFPQLSDAQKMVFTVLVLGIVSGALPVLATDLKSYTIYLLLNIMPLALMNLANPDIAIKLIGAVTLIFIGMLMLAAYLFNRALLDSMIYRYRSEHLADRLKVANKRLSAANQELEQISTIDELTGTYNRRFFNQRFDEIWADHARQNQSLAALMIDVDHFKDYNDFFGHLQGDLCLKRIASEINAVVHRPRDFVARFGGEEFIMLLPTTELKGAKEIAERIHERIKQLQIPHKVKGSLNQVTVSIGGTTILPSSEYNSEKFLQRVDRALYQAKHQGRNTTVFL